MRGVGIDITSVRGIATSGNSFERHEGLSSVAKTGREAEVVADPPFAAAKGRNGPLTASPSPPRPPMLSGSARSLLESGHFLPEVPLTLQLLYA
jgi:hypothetical protein